MKPRKRKVVTLTQAKRTFDAFEKSVFVPVESWLLEDLLPEGLGDGYLGQDLRNWLDDGRELLKLIVYDREREKGGSYS